MNQVALIALSTAAAVVLGGLLYRSVKGSSMTVANKESDYDNSGRSGANSTWGGSRRNKSSNRRSKRIKR